MAGHGRGRGHAADQSAPAKTRVVALSMFEVTDLPSDAPAGAEATSQDGPRGAVAAIRGRVSNYRGDSMTGRFIEFDECLAFAPREG